ncbi:MAG: triose-phosphate isomerase [Candidatus Caldarchaeum sp.]|nr:triose-phosphate isomerase [Candidatus Caldarchaeum sp.]MDW8360473.1 triose-phosphate isomerase [Candidatus Caldarchaeum sp.]
MKLTYPAILLNFKSYKEAAGNRGLELAKTAERVASQTGVIVAVCPSIVEMAKFVQNVSIPVLSQHCDPYEPGPFTGAVVAEHLKEIGVAGSLLNHSEKRLKLSDISAAITRLRGVGLDTVVCADDLAAAAGAAALEPSAVAVEPPELIGSGISVSTAKPEVVAGAVKTVKAVKPNVHVICGAGVSSAEDVRKAVALGSEGVLLSSAYVKSRNPEQLLLELCKALLV